MARLPYVNLPDPEIPPTNMFALLANAETLFEPFMQYAVALLRDTAVDPIVRQQAILRVAALTPGAEYAWVQHEAYSRALGMSDEQVTACRTGDTDALVLRFTEEVVLHATPTDETFARMTDHYSAREIVELLLIIGAYMGATRIMATAQIDLEPPIGRTAVEAFLAPRG